MSQPLFYKNPIALLLDKHQDAGLKQDGDYAFAIQTNSVPVTVPEIADASKFFPIVFAADAATSPVAILGLRNNQNQFVKNGQWQKDTYIPAYIRRYPFAFTEAEGKLILCVDEKSGRFVEKVKKGDMRFFEGKEQSVLTKNAVDFCVQFQKDLVLTHSFSKLLKDKGLLKERQVTVTVPNEKQPISLGGFLTVDDEKFAALDSATLEEWHKNGILGLIYLHLASLTNFGRLIPAAKPAAKAAAKAKK